MTLVVDACPLVAFADLLDGYEALHGDAFTLLPADA